MAMHVWGVAYNQQSKIYSCIVIGELQLGRVHAGMTIEVQFTFNSIRVYFMELATCIHCMIHIDHDLNITSQFCE